MRGGVSAVTRQWVAAGRSSGPALRRRLSLGEGFSRNFPASTACLTADFRFRSGPASAFKIFAAPAGQPAALLPVGGAAQHGTAQLVQRPQQGRKAVLVALVLRQQRQRAVGVALRRVAAQRFAMPSAALVVGSFQLFSAVPMCPSYKNASSSAALAGRRSARSGRHSPPRAPAHRVGCAPAADRRQHGGRARRRQQEQHTLGRLLDDLQHRVGGRVPFRFCAP